MCTLVNVIPWRCIKKFTYFSVVEPYSLVEEGLNWDFDELKDATL